MPACICGSVITDCEIGNDVVVYRVSNLANSVIQDGAIVYNVGTLTGGRGVQFRRGREHAAGQ
jgi:bifunctional N-acetylglucosamine-1-phosphate-uridyltransferase/glucosamine-1-phosphate-acetyltransferase GlmU-like protein